MTDDHLDEANPVDQPAGQAPQKTGYPGQGAEKLLLLGGLGCLAFVALMVAVVVVGIATLIEFAKTQPELEIVAESLDATPPGELPQAPFQLSAPEAPAARLRNVDLTDIDPAPLAGTAQQLALRGDFLAAVQCQHMSVIKSNSGRYNLACYYSLAGNVTAAFYWLQSAAMEEGTDPDWATRDSDLVNVRKDKRWPRVLAFLRKCQQYWETTSFSETSLVLPRQATANQPIPVFIGLHGTGHFAHGFVDAEPYQAFADTMGVAFLGVSGTIPHGKQTFVWSEDLEKDLARIDAALEEVKGRVTPSEGQSVLFGFSQGGWLAGELAARHPDRFAGAILMSPGRRSDQELPIPEVRPEHRRQGIVVVCGAEEIPETVRMTRQYAKTFEELGSRVSLTLYAGMNTHSFPPDYVVKLPVWGRFILNPESAAPP